MFTCRKLIYLPIIAMLAFFGMFVFTSPVHAEDSVPPVSDTPAETQSEAPVVESAPAETQPEVSVADSPVEPPVEESAPPETSTEAPAEVVEPLPTETPVESSEPAVVSEPEPQTPSTGLATNLQIKLGEESTTYFNQAINDRQNPEVRSPVGLPQVVVLDQSGNSVPLATEEAGEALKEPDPYFFIGTTKLAFTATDCDPGIAGNQACAPGVDPLQAAFNYISLRGLSPVGGAIYVEEGTYDSLEIYGADWTSNFHAVPTALSLIGVKTGLLIPDKTVGSSVDHIINGYIDVRGMKSFLLQAFSIHSTSIYSIAIFRGNTGTLNLIDVDIENTGVGDGIIITDHTGAINLNMVNSSNNGEDGAYVNNKCIWVKNGSSYDCTNLPSAAITIKNSSFNNNGISGLTVLSNGTATLSGVSASYNLTYDGAYVQSKGLTINQSIFNNNGGSGLWVAAHDQGGATLVQNSQFNTNADMGIFVEQNGNVDIKNIRSTDNGSNGLWVDTCRGGPCVNPFTGNISVIQSEFGNNVKTATDPDPDWPFGGMVIQAKGTITLTDDYLGGNGDGSHPAYGARLVNTYGTWAINITNSDFNSNSADGLSALSKGVITLKDSSASGNTNNGAYLDNWFTGAVAGINILNSPDFVNKFNDNQSNGLEVYSKGVVVVNAIQANNNTGNITHPGTGTAGMGILVNNMGGTGAVTIDGVSGTTANGNGQDGIWVTSKGIITVKNMNADGNAGYGFNLDNHAGTGGVSVLVTLPRWNNNLTNNGQDGLHILSNGAVLVQRSNVNNNQHFGATIDNTGGLLGVTITDSSFNQNARVDMLTDPSEYGLYVKSRGSIVLTNINANQNGINDPDPGNQVTGNGVFLDNSGSSTPTAITITRGYFDENFGIGLDVASKGAVSYKTGDASRNHSNGVDIHNEMATGFQPVTINAVNISGNGGRGLNVISRGNIIISAMDVNNNGAEGTNLDNHLGTGTVSIAGTPSWWRYFGANGAEGLKINTNGAVTISYINLNDNGSYGARIENSGITAVVTLTGVNFYNNGLDDLATDRYGLYVIARGNITLDNVQVADNKSYGAILDNHLGTGTVTIKSTNGNEIRNNADYGLWVLSKGNITLTNIEVNNNGGIGAFLDNRYGTTGSVTINNTMYRNWQSNNGYGLQIDSPGAVVINLIDASNNSGTNTDIDNRYSTLATPPGVTITNSTFNNSPADFGLIVYSKGNINVTSIQADNNSSSGVYLTNGGAGGKGNVTVSGKSVDEKSTFNNNLGYGLRIVSNGAVTIKFINVNNNPNYGTSIDNSTAATPQAVSISFSDFTNNSLQTAGYGLRVYSRGSITLTDVFAGWNGNAGEGIAADGIILDNCRLNSDPSPLCTGNGSITLTNSGSWGNNGDGLNVESFGTITVSNGFASGNTENGGTFHNNYSMVNPNPLLPAIKSVAGVTISLPAGYSNTWGEFQDNGGYGLEIKSNGAVSVATVNVKNNGTSGNAAFIDNSTAATPLPVTITKSKFNDNNSAIRGILVLSKGAITFSNNEVNNNQGANADDQGAAQFDNCGFDLASQTCTGTGTGNVTVTSSSFHLNGNSGFGDGLLVFTRGSVLLTNVNASGNADEGIEINAASGNGTITLNGTRNEFNYNGHIGVGFIAKSNVTVTNIVADYNGLGLYIDNCGFDGVTRICSGTGTGSISVTNADMNRNANQGIWANSNGIMTLTNVDGLGNIAEGALLYSNSNNPALPITITITGSSFQGNQGSGIWSDTLPGKTLKLVGTSFLGNDTENTGDPNIRINPGGLISIS